VEGDAGPRGCGWWDGGGDERARVGAVAPKKGAGGRGRPGLAVAGRFGGPILIGVEPAENRWVIRGAGSWAGMGGRGKEAGAISFGLIDCLSDGTFGSPPGDARAPEVGRGQRCGRPGVDARTRCTPPLARPGWACLVWMYWMNAHARDRPVWPAPAMGVWPVDEELKDGVDRASRDDVDQMRMTP